MDHGDSSSHHLQRAGPARCMYRECPLLKMGHVSFHKSSRRPTKSALGKVHASKTAGPGIEVAKPCTMHLANQGSRKTRVVIDSMYVLLLHPQKQPVFDAIDLSLTPDSPQIAQNQATRSRLCLRLDTSREIVLPRAFWPHQFAIPKKCKELYLSAKRTPKAGFTSRPCCIRRRRSESRRSRRWTGRCTDRARPCRLRRTRYSGGAESWSGSVPKSSRTRRCRPS